jgi:hypothetical protein
MTNKEFTYWLQGFFMLEEDITLSQEQLLIIKNHLNLTKAVDGELTKTNLEIEEYLTSTDYSEKHLQQITIYIKNLILKPS